MNLLQSLFADRTRTRSRDRKSNRYRPMGLESLEERKVLSTVPGSLSEAAAAHLISRPPAEVLSSTARAPHGAVQKSALSLNQYSLTLRIYNNLSVNLSSLEVTHSFGSITDRFNFAPINAGQTSSPQTVRYYSGPGAADDYWTISATYYDSNTGAEFWVFKGLARFDLNANEAFQDLDISVDQKTNPNWHESGIDYDFYVTQFSGPPQTASFNATVSEL